jgi:putative transposase
VLAVPGTFFLFFQYFSFFIEAPRMLMPLKEVTGTKTWRLTMRKKRLFIEGAFYHVTSRTNDKIQVFDKKPGQKVMLLTLRDAKEKFNFSLTNFCIMPTHIHLLIQPSEGTCLSSIMQWIKTMSAKRWNFIHGSTDHLWGHRYFARAIKDMREYEYVMNYIDQNPVAAGLVLDPADWKASGAFYKAHIDLVPGTIGGLDKLINIGYKNKKERGS